MCHSSKGVEKEGINKDRAAAQDSPDRGVHTQDYHRESKGYCTKGMVIFEYRPGSSVNGQYDEVLVKTTRV